MTILIQALRWSVIAAVVTLSACNLGSSSLAQAEQAKLKTDDSFAHPKEIGQLADGRTLYEVKHYSVDEPTSTIYVAGVSVTASTVTSGPLGQNVVQTTTSIDRIGNLTTDQRLKKAQILVAEANKLVFQAQLAENRRKIDGPTPLVTPSPHK